MNDRSFKVQLKFSAILNVPLQIYDDSFMFIVNGKEFKTTKLISDLLSPIICKIHYSDPSSNSFTIDTTKKGDFSYILNLINFDKISIPYSEIPFLYEVLEILGNDSIEQDYSINVDFNNVFYLIQQYSQNKSFFSKEFQYAVDYLSVHFSEFSEKYKEDFAHLPIDIIIKIISNNQLKLKDENQLLEFINYLYSIDTKYSVLYENVYFDYVDLKGMNEFLSILDFNDITNETWRRLSIRLKQEIKNNKEKDKEFIKKRYLKQEQKGTSFLILNEHSISGIINHFVNETKGQISDEINITASSINDESRCPQNITLFGDPSKFFASQDKENSWICYEFKNHEVIPSGYTIRSISFRSNDCHPKSWVIEASNDENNWDTLDEQKNCSFLNGRSLIHTFKINSNTSNKYKYIRMRQTGINWKGNNYLLIESFEIYGTLI